MKILNIFLLISLVNFFTIKSCNQNKTKLIEKDSLILVNSTPKILCTPESVLFHEQSNIFFVSNINGNPTEKDNNGFISKINENGEIIDFKWVTNLDAPKGMCIFENKLYVTDITKIYIIDILTSEYIDFFEIPDAKFLNDLTADSTGRIYFSDMQDNKIYTFFDNKTQLLEIENLDSPNGLFYENNKIYIGCSNYIIEYDIQTKKSKIIIENTGAIDGITKIDNNTFIISNWEGNIKIIRNNNISNLFTSKVKDLKTADFEFVKNKNILLVPTFFDNKVLIFNLTKIIK